MINKKYLCYLLTECAIKKYVEKYFAVKKITITFVTEICGRDLSLSKISEN
ncbi:MAG: hypothetical protein J5709_08755 [Bacteroidales bacterium]|nr:hypothetical protein [Bacteroidales bacterium]